MGKGTFSEKEWKLLRNILMIRSTPPAGMCKIINIYWDPKLKRAVFEYEDEPVEEGG